MAKPISLSVPALVFTAVFGPVGSFDWNPVTETKLSSYDKASFPAELWQVEVTCPGLHSRTMLYIARHAERKNGRAQWCVWYGDGKLFSGYGTTRQDALERALKFAWTRRV